MSAAWDPMGVGDAPEVWDLRTLTFRGYPLLGRRKLAKTLNGPGALPDAEVRALAALLAERFRAA